MTGRCTIPEPSALEFIWDNSRGLSSATDLCGVWGGLRTQLQLLACQLLPTEPCLALGLRRACQGRGPIGSPRPLCLQGRSLRPRERKRIPACWIALSITEEIKKCTGLVHICRYIQYSPLIYSFAFLRFQLPMVHCGSQRLN